MTGLTALGAGLGLAGALGKRAGAASQTASERGGRWRDAAALPVPVQEIYPALHKGGLYIAGGIASGTLTPYFSDDLLRFDFQDNRWTKEATLPETLHHVTLISAPVAKTPALMAFGGFRGSLLQGIWQMRDTIWRLEQKDGEVGAWVDAGRMPRPMAETVTGQFGSDIHFVGGRRIFDESNSRRDDHEDVAEHHVYDAATGLWRQAAPSEVRRNSAAGGVLRGRLHIAGGRNETGNLMDHEAYDPITDRWQRLAPLPKPQAGLAGAVLDDRLYVFGGEIFQPERAVFPDCWVYEPGRDAWTALPPMPTARHGLGAVAYDGEIYVVGGATEPGGSGRSTKNEVFKPV